MQIKEAHAKLRAVMGNSRVKRDAPMHRHTSFKIGGPADLLTCPETRQQLLYCYRTGRKYGLPVFLMGNGSNLLVGDEGIRGMVIKTAGGFGGFYVEDGMVRAQAGILLSRLTSMALKKGFTDLEFASGIPGSLGGAVVMNAGAYGGQMSDVVVRVTAYDKEQDLVRVFEKEELDYGYRHSVFRDTDMIVLDATLALSRGDVAAAKRTVAELNARRREKQPLKYPSAGSIFKRPEGHFAGTLIEEAGCKGMRVGDAVVSEKHAGFIVNTGSATAGDVLRLIEQVRQKVHEKSGLWLEPEVHVVGEM
jgi:UDP-N-acetylmuramate dehydrogenase